MPDAFRDEVDLVERAIAGDADAFGELYQRHMDAIYRYIYFRVGNVKDAEDLTEHVFLKAWEALADYEQRGNPFTSWLYRIAHNSVVDYHRQQHPVVSTPLLEQGDWTSDEPTALEQIIAAEETDALASAIAQLPEAYQEVVILRFIEGLRHAEVSQIINKSEGACRVMQHRALSALHQTLIDAREEVDYA
jgi:RNA polymerase sigma-70 factor (ECF subfamily)